MDRHTIVTKTAKGVLELSGRTSDLPRDLRDVLKEVDGKSTVGRLAEKLGVVAGTKLIEVLDRLQREGYVRSFATAPQTLSPPSQSPVAMGMDDLDFTHLTILERKSAEARRQQSQAEEIARQAAATRAREAARERVRLEAALRVKAGQR